MGGRRIIIVHMILILVHSHLVPIIIQQSVLYSYKQGYTCFSTWHLNTHYSPLRKRTMP